MKEGDALKPVTREITQERIERYAVAAGDFNPIHIDADFASRSHFGRRIAHGMLVAATISEMMTLNYGQPWLRSGKLKLRLKAPVFPGDTVTARGQVKSAKEETGTRHVACVVEVVRPDGEVAITGEATVTAA
ncbi:MAG: acyl dehydratase [SAR202 cluster bacterium]|nr:acyl dehydratase [SAR202 cluster bacterium]